EFGAQSIVQFQRTPPMPSYLVALATGPFDTLAVPGLPVPGRVVTCAGQSELGAEAARVAPALLKQLENYFGQAYPYAKLDLIADAAFPDSGIGGTSVGQSDAAMQADARATARAMRRPVASAERLDQLADGLTYARGRSVLSMFEQWLGSRVFQAGVASYLE